MAFVVNPKQGASQGKSRPKVRPGNKVMAAAGIVKGTTSGGYDKWTVCFVVIEDPDGGQDVGALVWDSLILTEKSVWKLEILADAVGQNAPWDAEKRNEMWDVVSKSPVLCGIEMEQKWDGSGEEGRIKTTNKWSGEITEEMQKVISGARSWHREKYSTGGNSPGQYGSGNYGGSYGGPSGSGPSGYGNTNGGWSNNSNTSTNQQYEQDDIPF